MHFFFETEFSPECPGTYSLIYRSACPYLPSAGIKVMCHQDWLKDMNFNNKKGCSVFEDWVEKVLIIL